MGYTRDQFSNSKFLKAGDLKLPDGSYTTKVVTITGAREHTFADKTKQLVLSFAGEAKEWGFSAAAVWAQMEQVTGSGNSDNWNGKQIELYVDPTVTYMGQPKPAIRVRKPSGGAPFTPNVPSAPAAPTAPAGGFGKSDAWAHWYKAIGPGVDPQKFVAAVQAINPDESKLTAADWVAVAKQAGGVVVKDGIPW